MSRKAGCQRKYLTWEEFEYLYRDAFNYIKKDGANQEMLRLCDRLQKEQKSNFPEVTIKQAAFLLGANEQNILQMLRTGNVRGRHVLGDHFLPLCDVWDLKQGHNVWNRKRGKALL